MLQTSAYARGGYDLIS